MALVSLKTCVNLGISTDPSVDTVTSSCELCEEILNLKMRIFQLDSAHRFSWHCSSVWYYFCKTSRTNVFVHKHPINNVDLNWLDIVVTPVRFCSFFAHVNLNQKRLSLKNAVKPRLNSNTIAFVSTGINCTAEWDRKFSFRIQRQYFSVRRFLRGQVG